MLRIAVVEDDDQDAANLMQCLRRFQQEKGTELYIKRYSDGSNLIAEKRIDYDLIFLDIEMSHMDGLSTAKALRETDDSVCIVFVTNLSKYAIQSYEVNALDYVMKPVQYSLLANKMKRVLGYIERNQKNSLWIGEHDGMIRLRSSDLISVQKDKNYFVYHTSDGDYRERGTLSDAEEKCRRKVL